MRRTLPPLRQRMALVLRALPGRPVTVQILARAMSEDELDDLIREACRVRGLLAYHTHDSRRSEPGFPDWVIVGPGGVLFRECKGYDGRGRLGKYTADQAKWHAHLLFAGADSDYWYPEHWCCGFIDHELDALKVAKPHEPKALTHVLVDAAPWRLTACRADSSGLVIAPSDATVTCPTCRRGVGL